MHTGIYWKRVYLDIWFDGDTMSAYCVMTDEAKKEVNDMLNSRNFYLTLDSKMAFSLNTDMISLSLKYLTTPR